MGSFSWLRADKETKVKNVAYGKKFKFLIPQEFGGGSITDTYQDYGYLGTNENGEPKYDMYELLAFWNGCKGLKYKGDKPLMKEIDEDTDFNRNFGIDIGCYDDEIKMLKFPLKLVSPRCKLSYEEVEQPSLGDPDQGFYETHIVD